MDRKAMGALFKMIVVIAVLLILIGTFVVLMIKLGKRGAGMVSPENIGIFLLVPAAKARQMLARFK